VDSQPHFVIPLAEVTQSHDSLVGAKAARLGTLAKAGHPVAPGFCVTVRAYDLFLAESRLAICSFTSAEALFRIDLDASDEGAGVQFVRHQSDEVSAQ
jgi:phosphoenolpyruvate synthase/pyruvate phosphate dikinase